MNPNKEPILRLLPQGMGFFPLKDEEIKDDPLFWNGRLLIFEGPRNDAFYALGIDCAEGVGADRSVVEVIRIGTNKEPDEQVAEFCSNRHGPHDLAPIAASLGRFYRDPEGEEALAVVEANGPGDACLMDLRTKQDYGNLYVRKNYDRRTQLFTQKLGFWTNQTTRPKIIARFQYALKNRDIVLNSPFLLDEMEDFQRDHFQAIARAKSGRHDDRVLAAMIGFWGAHDDEWISGEDIAGERRALTLTGKLREAEAASGTKRDYQNSCITYEAMLQAWEDED